MVDNLARYKFLLFFDTYFGYKQILMYEPDKDKIDFMTEQVNYQYDVMLFGLKNAIAAY